MAAHLRCARSVQRYRTIHSLTTNCILCGRGGTTPVTVVVEVARLVCRRGEPIICSVAAGFLWCGCERQKNTTVNEATLPASIATRGPSAATASAMQVYSGQRPPGGRWTLLAGWIGRVEFGSGLQSDGYLSLLCSIRDQLSWTGSSPSLPFPRHSPHSLSLSLSPIASAPYFSRRRSTRAAN